MPRVPSPREKIWAKENNPLAWIDGHVEGSLAGPSATATMPGSTLPERQTLHSFTRNTWCCSISATPTPALNRSRLE